MYILWHPFLYHKKLIPEFVIQKYSHLCNKQYIAKSKVVKFGC